MTLPRVQPIAPTWRKEPFDHPDWLFDVKYDGFRALYYIEPGHNRLISRNGNVQTRFDPLAGALAAELDVDDAIIDGVGRTSKFKCIPVPITVSIAPTRRGANCRNFAPPPALSRLSERIRLNLERVRS